jgi:hypothetical protein
MTVLMTFLGVGIWPRPLPLREARSSFLKGPVLLAVHQHQVGAAVCVRAFRSGVGAGTAL